MNGVAVAANCTSGIALYGFSSSDTGLDVGSNSGSGIDAYVDEAAVHFRLGGASPPPSTAYARIAGSIVCDTDGDLWYCVASGTPGTWRKVSGAGTAGALHILPTPVRVYDSRPCYLPNIGTKAPLPGNTPRPCDLKANGSGVPAGATAALISLTATNTAGSGGFLSVYRAGIAWPGTSNLNWSPPRTGTSR
ncbi:hypothetical protein [Rhabdothermincola sp.]|uniref:hypothetical protein n=1 Tax=Rhabdothermincola sp. TaxID=2820405 RepID=UPI002FDF3221